MNKAILMGRLTADPELKMTNNGTPVCSFTLAVPRRFQRDTSDFINIVTWKKTAEFVSNYFAKGQQIAVCGSIQSRKYQDKNGNNHTVIEVIADEVDFCGNKKEQPAPEDEPPKKPSFSIPDGGDFEAVDNDSDLPFYEDVL